jgi:HEAT repeat protein
MEYEEDLPEDAEVPVPTVNPEFYRQSKEFLLERVDALMESMEVRRRAVESLGYLAWKPQVRELVLRYYRQAPNAWVKVSAIYAMGLVRDPVFERIILEELYCENDDVLVEAAHAAHTLELHAAEPRLWELARHPNLDVRCEAVVALGVIGSLERLPRFFRQVEAENKGSEDMAEALEQARGMLKQRSMLDKGENIWDDNLVLSEIDEMLENPGSP